MPASLFAALPLLIALLAGAAVPFQAGSNAALGRLLGHPLWAAGVSLLVRGCSGGTITLCGSKRSDGICVPAYSATLRAAISATSSQPQPGTSAAERAFQHHHSCPMQNTRIASNHSSACLYLLHWLVGTANLHAQAGPLSRQVDRARQHRDQQHIEPAPARHILRRLRLAAPPPLPQAEQQDCQCPQVVAGSETGKRQEFIAAVVRQPLDAQATERQAQGDQASAKRHPAKTPAGEDRQPQQWIGKPLVPPEGNAPWAHEQYLQRRHMPVDAHQQAIETQAKKEQHKGEHHIKSRHAQAPSSSERRDHSSSGRQATGGSSSRP
ncbi:hypothetical protein WR25_10991 [Diploscapter pachys]|uniref:Uncharacterized protein n=1 Tax=Diploscapter pachys TaxID=2018661 RepID=A0A2A2K4E8_9BILA|nr:hypothetical protein WR25_10991 [Diploscapter pachys]